MIGQALDVVGCFESSPTQVSQLSLASKPPSPFPLKRNGGDSSSEPPPPSVTTVSRILSGRVAPAWTAISLKDPRRTMDPRPSCDGCDVTRGPARPLVELRSRRPLPLFCLAPHRVFRAPSVALGAVGSYPAFSPLPRSCDRGGLFSVTLSVDRGFRPCLPRILRGMPPCGVRTFLQDCSQRSSTVTPYL